LNLLPAATPVEQGPNEVKSVHNFGSGESPGLDYGGIIGCVRLGCSSAPEVDVGIVDPRVDDGDFDAFARDAEGVVDPRGANESNASRIVKGDLFIAMNAHHIRVESG